MDIDMDKEIWEGWTVGKFIKYLEWEADLIMGGGHNYLRPFANRREMEAWCGDNQPYIKREIKEVNEYFASKYGLR